MVTPPTRPAGARRRRFLPNIRAAAVAAMLVGACAGARPSTKESGEAKGDRLPPSVRSLAERPGWLFPAVACPADVMSPPRTAPKTFADGCAFDPGACLDRCRQGDGDGCYGLALRLQQLEEHTYAEALFLRACKLGVASGCTNRAAHILHFEAEAPGRLACSARTFERTCAYEDPWGCTMYGLVLKDGLGVPKDPKKALEVLPGGCRLGEADPACQNARELERAIRAPVSPEGAGKQAPGPAGARARRGAIARW